MIISLIQKHPFKGIRKFELTDDEIFCEITSPIKNESLSVVLNVLDSEPLIASSSLSFVSKVNREPLVEFLSDQPDKEQFNQFIQRLRENIIKQDFSRCSTTHFSVAVDPVKLEEEIDMLQRYINPSDIRSLLNALTDLKDNPNQPELLNQVAGIFNQLGFVQGQVITYAPYVNFLLSANHQQHPK